MSNPSSVPLGSPYFRPMQDLSAQVEQQIAFFEGVLTRRTNVQPEAYQQAIQTTNQLGITIIDLVQKGQLGAMTTPYINGSCDRINSMMPQCTDPYTREALSRLGGALGTEKIMRTFPGGQASNQRTQFASKR